MPLVVKDFTWEESEKNVYVTVPLKGVKANKVDIFSSEEYLKVSYPPYLFECLLNYPIDDLSSTAQVGNGTVVFKLQKKEEKIWSQLQSNDSGNKEIMKLKREEALKKVQERTAKESEERAEKKREHEKYSLNKMMKLEEDERKRIQDVKDSERKQAMDELEQWKSEQIAAAEKEKLRLTEERKLAEKTRNEENLNKNKNDIFDESYKSKKKGKGTNDVFIENAGGVPTRKSGQIDITFTPRVFPTPVRESQTPQEEEWLKKQADARRAVEIEDQDLTEEEKNPVYLRDKGNSFFKAGDYHSAINAYSHAARLNPKLPALYSNRGACHLKLQNYMKCIEDCSKALDLLLPPVPQNADSRCKAYVRRGTAFCQLELYVEGLQDYEAALRITPENEQLKKDAEQIRHIIQSSTIS